MDRLPRPPFGPSRWTTAGSAGLVAAFAALVWCWYGHLKPCRKHERACHARELLRALVAAGATVGVQLDFRDDPQRGLGVFIREEVLANTSLLNLPRSLWLVSDGCPDADAQTGDCVGYTTGSRLPLALGRERRRPSAPHLAAYVDSMPAECPPNLAARPEADRALANASPRHTWKVQVLRKDLQVLERELPEADDAERRLLTCLKMSRAFNDHSDPPPAVDSPFGYCRAAMIPLFDLMNHGSERTVRDAWSARDGLTLLAARDLSAGEELVHPYGEPASAARLLLSFGIVTADAPAAALEVEGMPDAEVGEAFLRRHGCAGTPHVALRSAEPNEVDLIAGVRCLRLRLYSPEEADWAVGSGHLDATRLDGRVEGRLHEACLVKDATVVGAAGRFCADELRLGADDQAQGKGPSASDEVRRAVAAEEAALRACVEAASAVLEALRRTQSSALAEVLRELEDG